MAIAIGRWLKRGLHALVERLTAPPSPYRSRGCAGRSWRRRFPDADANLIRTFLDCLTHGMAFSPAARLKFRPEDVVLDIYKGIYGGRVPFGDALECETFADNLSRAFKADPDFVHGCWRPDVTLGELFESVVLRHAS